MGTSYAAFREGGGKKPQRPAARASVLELCPRVRETRAVGGANPTPIKLRDSQHLERSLSARPPLRRWLSWLVHAGEEAELRLRPITDVDTQWQQ